MTDQPAGMSEKRLREIKEIAASGMAIDADGLDELTDEIDRLRGERVAVRGMMRAYGEEHADRHEITSRLARHYRKTDDYKTTPNALQSTPGMCRWCRATGIDTENEFQTIPCPVCRSRKVDDDD